MSGIDSLFVAVKSGHREMATYFLDHGDNPNIQDSEGLTALAIVSKNGHKSIEELLKDGV